MKRLWRWYVRRTGAERRWHVLAMLVVLTLSFAVRLDHVVRSLPYSRHVDEGT